MFSVLGSRFSPRALAPLRLCARSSYRMTAAFPPGRRRRVQQDRAAASRTCSVPPQASCRNEPWRSSVAQRDPHACHRPVVARPDPVAAPPNDSTCRKRERPPRSSPPRPPASRRSCRRPPSSRRPSVSLRQAPSSTPAGRSPFAEVDHVAAIVAWFAELICHTRRVSRRHRCGRRPHDVRLQEDELPLHAR